MNDTGGEERREQWKHLLTLNGGYLHVRIQKRCLVCDNVYRNENCGRLSVVCGEAGNILKVAVFLHTE